MSDVIFNPNPAVFAPSKASSTRKSDNGTRRSLWIDEGDDLNGQNLDDDAVEPIDQDEVYGS